MRWVAVVEFDSASSRHVGTPPSVRRAVDAVRDLTAERGDAERLLDLVRPVVVDVVRVRLDGADVLAFDVFVVVRFISVA